LIFNGSKTVELRRVCPTMSPGDLALVYVSFPAKELRGAFEVGKIISASPSVLWRLVGKKCGITRKEFFAYFHGKVTAHALVITRSWKLPMPVRLATLQRGNGGFRPPQNFLYLNRNGASGLASLVAPKHN
jgi:predicted transcriptional regulator